MSKEKAKIRRQIQRKREEIVSAESKIKDETIGLLLAFFGFHLINIGETGKFVMFLISFFFVVGFIWYIIQLVNCSKELKAINMPILNEINSLKDEIMDLEEAMDEL